MHSECIAKKSERAYILHAYSMMSAAWTAVAGSTIHKVCSQTKVPLMMKKKKKTTTECQTNQEIENTLNRNLHSK